MTFINCSNHPTRFWSSNQISSAKKWGNLIDIDFPLVSADLGETEIEELAIKTVEEIVRMSPDAVMCQGEFTLTYAIVRLLKARNIKVMAACSERCTIENIKKDGSIEKKSVFRFKKFRFY